MGATFNRVKNWAAEILTNEDLNAEIDNILTNLTPSGIDDYSSNTAQMQVQTAPIDNDGAPVLSTSLAQEIAKIRYQLKQIIGADVTYWYEAPNTTLSGLNSVVSGNTVPSTRVESIGSTSYINRLDPDGTAATVTLTASGSESIVYYINDIRYELTSSISLTNLSAPASTNNTALFDGTAYSGLHASTYLGEHDTTMAIGTIGSNISGATGATAFKVVRGGTTEYFTAEYITNALTKARRGGFFDKDNAAWSRTTIETGDTITLCKLAWIFLTSSATLTTTYNTPTWSYDEPSSPNTGDYWFDMSTSNWKVYDSLAFIAADAVLIGQAIVDGSACVAARSVEPYKLYSGVNECALEINSGGTGIQLKNLQSKVSVYGADYFLGRQSNVWSADDLESGSTLATAQTYYAYVKESGDIALSTLAPHDRRGDLSGYYHPAKSWRCLGYATTSSSLFTTQSLVDYSVVNDVSFKGQIKSYNLPAANIVFSSASGSYSNDTTDFTNVTNLSVEIVSQGKPIEINFTGTGSSPSYFYANGATQTASAYFRLMRDGTTEITRYQLSSFVNEATNPIISVPPSTISMIDLPGEGTFTYTLQGARTTLAGSTSTAGAVNVVMYAKRSI